MIRSPSKPKRHYRSELEQVETAEHSSEFSMKVQAAAYECKLAYAEFKKHIFEHGC